MRDARNRHYLRSPLSLSLSLLLFGTGKYIGTYIIFQINLGSDVERDVQRRVFSLWRAVVQVEHVQCLPLAVGNI